MKSILSLLLILGASLVAIGQPLTKKAYTDFKGTLGGKNIQMSLYCFTNNDLAGHYYFTEGNQAYEKITLQGSLKGNQITLRGYDYSNGSNETIIEELKGEKAQYQDFAGECVVSKTQQKMAFKLKVNTVVNTPTFGKRYADLSLYDDQIERFVKKLKAAILNKDQEFLTHVVQYPIKVKIKKRLRTIENKKAFKKRFEYIINNHLLEQVKQVNPYDLFMRNGQMMLGNGCIWLQERNHTLKVIAINN